MVEQSKTTLSQAALETLAIIAYNQPITRAKVGEYFDKSCSNPCLYKPHLKQSIVT